MIYNKLQFYYISITIQLQSITVTIAINYNDLQQITIQLQ